MKSQTTQSFVPLKEIRDGIIIREDGVYCAVILVSTLNFDLKSATEREAILFQFQSMLNSLEIGIQILIQSRRLNTKPYIEFLESIYQKQGVDLLKLQTREYVNFIKNFTELNEIMTKQFFIIIPYSPINISSNVSFFNKSKGKDKKTTFEENSSQLQQRVEYIQNNVRSLGLRAIQLQTEEVTELLYQTFNPGDTQAPPQTN